MSGPDARQHPRGEGAVGSDQVGDRVDGQPSSPVYEVRPLRRTDLAHLPAVRTLSYWDALVAAGRMPNACIVWQRRTEAVTPC